MGEAMGRVDWARTPVGPVASWPRSLKTIVRTMLECRLPMYVAWGPELIQFYNDAYRPILGDKHVGAMGGRAAEVWSEIWPTIWPMWQEVLAGKAIGFDDFKLTIERFGYPEDCYFNFSYSPVRDDAGAIAGVLVTFAETTRLVLSEKRLLAQQEELRSTFMQAPASIAIFRGPDHVFEFANRPYLEMLGRDELVGKSVRDALPEIRESGIYEVLDGVYRTGEPFVAREYPVPISKSPGAPPEMCYFSFNLHPLRDNAGLIFGQIVVALDITPQVVARRKLEALTGDLLVKQDALQESEARYRELADAMPQIVWTAGPDGRIDYFNQRWREYTGASTVAGAEAWEEYVHPEDLAVCRERWRASVAEGIPLEVKYRLRRAKAGDYRWHLGRALPVRDDSGRVVRWHGTGTDVHDQQMAEADLRSARLRLDLVPSATDLGLWYCDLPFDELVWNAQVKNHFWLPPDARVTIDLFYERIHPDDRERTRAAIDEAISSGRPYDTRYRTVNARDGKTKWIRAVGRGFRDPDGNPTSFDGITLDVTALRAREDRERLLLNAAERLSGTLNVQEALRAIAETAVPALADWVIVDLLSEDGALERITVAHPDETRRELARRLHREYPPTRAHGLWRAMSTGVPVLVPEVDDESLTRTARDGTHLAILRALDLKSYAILPLLAHGKVLGVMTLITHGDRRLVEDEISAGKDLASRAAASLANAQSYERAEKLRGQAETLHQVGLTVAGELDLQRVVQSITDAGLALTGGAFGAFFYNVNDDKGGRYTLYSISGVPREAFSKFPMPRATAIFGPTFRGEGVIRLADVRKDPRFGMNAPYHGMPAGHLPVVSYLAVPVRSRSGEVLGGLFYGHTEADRFSADHERAVVGIAAQAAIAIDNAQLFKAAERKTAELARANEELQQFAYISSHDLQEPLRTVTQYLDLLQLRFADVLDERGKRYIAAAVGSTARMQTLISDLLDYSRLGSDAPVLRGVPLAEVLADVLRDLHATIVERRADIRVPELPKVAIDATKVRLVLQNLIGNALKFSANGEPVIEISCADEADSWRIGVRDNGIGIAPEHHARIFEVFQRLHHREQYAGTGIGLAICKKAVEQHGGRIWVESAAGAGATFSFTLPKRPDGGQP
jgi:PAS domain S-box-containing protein